MGLFKAIGKFALRSANNAAHHNDQKRAHNEAYSQTGKELKRAKCNGLYINASALYRKKYNAAIKKADEKHDLRNKFIDDL